MLKKKKIIYIILFLSIILLYAWRSLNVSIFDDFLWHIKLGEWILENKQIPKVDVFTWLYEGKNQLMVCHEWLAEILFVFLNRFLEPYWILMLLVTLTFLTLGIVLYPDFIKKDTLSIFFLTFIATFSFLSTALVRPHIFSYIFTIITVKALEDIKDNKNSKLYLIIPLITILWTNMHGGTVILAILFPLGFLICSFFNFKINKIEKIREPKENKIKYLYLIVGNFIASIINPYTIDIYKYALLDHNEQLKSRVNEWARLSIQNPYGFLIIVAIIIFLIALNKTIDFTDISMLTVFIFLTCLYQRFYSWTAFIFLVAFIKYFEDEKENSSKLLNFSFKDKRIFIQIEIIAIFICILILFISAISKSGIPKVKHLVNPKIIEAIKEEKPERMYNSYYIGGLLVYYDEKVFSYSIALSNEEDLEVSKILDDLEVNIYEKEKEYNFDYYLTDVDSPLAFYLENTPEKYEIIYKDETDYFPNKLLFAKIK